MPVFSGHTGVTNVELLIYIFFVGGGYNFSYILGNTLYIIICAGRHFLGGGEGGDTEVGTTIGKISERPHHTQKPALLYNVTKLVVSPHSKYVKFKLPHPLIKTFWTTGAGQNPFTVSGRLILSSTVFISSDSYQFV